MPTLKPITSMERFLDAIRQAVEFTATNTSSETTLKESRIIQPVDVQAHYQQTIQTHTNAMVAPSTSAFSPWIDGAGFDELAVTLMNDSSTTSHVDVQWSNDGTNYHAADYSVVPLNNVIRKTGLTPMKARYFRISVGNGDAAPHTLNAWAFLKA